MSYCAADVLSLQERQQLHLSSLDVIKSEDVESAYTSGDSSGSLTLTGTLHAHYRSVYLSVSAYS